jgi:hypothetical protein
VRIRCGLATRLLELASNRENRKSEERNDNQEENIRADYGRSVFAFVSCRAFRISGDRRRKYFAAGTLNKVGLRADPAPLFGIAYNFKKQSRAN